MKYTAGMNRRTFLETSIATCCLSALHVSLFAPEHRIDRVGLQLYTVRDLMKSEFEGTLAKVAGVGYKEVEFARLFDHSPKDVRAMLDRDGLTAPSGHVSYAIIETKWPETLDAAHVLGQQFIVCPWIDESQRKQPDGWKRAADLFNRAGEGSQKAGLQFAYHNHTFEFEPSGTLGGKLPYDFLLANTDPKLVKMEMDLCWATVGGADPLKYFDEYPGRFPLVHAKDWKGPGGTAKEEHTRMADVGQGSIDWKRIFAQSGKAGIRHYFVENDSPKSPIDDIRASFIYLRDLRF
jgi:sugar phosphate isomerase/epimerase